MMKKWITLLLAILLAMAGLSSLAEEYHIDEGNMEYFSTLLTDLLSAYEAPSEDDAQRLEADLEAIRTVSESDGEIARSIAEHWRTVFMDPDYALCLYDGGEYATALEQSLFDDIDTHAFVVLGFQLKDGEMTEELMGRCEAAAAAARSFPGAILVCSGGATGENNPEGHTEAGLMKGFLVESCGIDASRIFIDEQAMTTVENAINTFGILEANGVGTMTIVTSAYHERRAQVIYNAIGALYGKTHGYSVRMIGNYCLDIEPFDEGQRNDAQIAIRQLTSVLGLPQDEGGMPKK